MAGLDVARGALLGESRGGELPERLQQPEAATGGSVDGGDHRPLDEVTEQPVDIDRVEPVIGADRLGGREVERAR